MEGTPAASKIGTLLCAVAVVGPVAVVLEETGSACDGSTMGAGAGSSTGARLSAGARSLTGARISTGGGSSSTGARSVGGPCPVPQLGPRSWHEGQPASA